MYRSIGIHYIFTIVHCYGSETCATATERRVLVSAQRDHVRHKQLTLDVLKQFRLIYGSVRHHFRQVEETCGVSGSQIWMLHELHSAPGIGVSDLAHRLSIHQTTCSQLVEKLVARGYVEKTRSEEDQRRVGLTNHEKCRQGSQGCARPC